MAGGPFPCGCCCKLCDDMAVNPGPDWSIVLSGSTDFAVGIANAQNSNNRWYYWDTGGIASLVNGTHVLKFETAPSEITSTFYRWDKTISVTGLSLITTLHLSDGFEPTPPPATAYDNTIPARDYRFDSLEIMLRLIQARTGHSSGPCKTRQIGIDVMCDKQADPLLTPSPPNLMLLFTGSGSHTLANCSAGPYNGRPLNALGLLGSEGAGAVGIAFGQYRPPLTNPTTMQITRV